jgi:hypothetical protein
VTEVAHRFGGGPAGTSTAASGTESGDLEQAAWLRLLEALLSPRDLTYREIAGELGISQGGLGPERLGCLECARRLLAPEVAARQVRG